MEIANIDIISLAGRYTKLKRIAAGNGGEYAGPCPKCPQGGGRDRFHAQRSPEARSDGRGSWFCRQCHPTPGDAVDFIRWYEGVDYPTACERLDLPLDELGGVQTEREPEAPAICEAPGADWQAWAGPLVSRCYDAMWSGDYPKPRAWLHSRGFTDQTILDAALGYNPADIWDEVHGWLPRGIVAPWFIDEALWKVNIRRPLNTDGRGKYITLKGSSNALYNAWALAPGRPAMIVEGLFDALAVQQVCGDLVAPVAAGTTGARHLVWHLRLQRCPLVLVALDSDESGDAASRYWLDVLGARALRWRPLLKDPAEMLEKGIDLQSWVEVGLEMERQAA